MKNQIKMYMFEFCAESNFHLNYLISELLILHHKCLKAIALLVLSDLKIDVVLVATVWVLT